MTAETSERIAPALLTIPQVCAYLNIARPTFYKINATGAFGLLPVKLGSCRKVLYRRDEIEKWIQANCPGRIEPFVRAIAASAPSMCLCHTFETSCTKAEYGEW